MTTLNQSEQLEAWKTSLVTQESSQLVLFLLIVSCKLKDATSKSEMPLVAQQILVWSELIVVCGGKVQYENGEADAAS